MLHPKTKKNLLVVNNMLILKSLKQIDFRKKQNLWYMNMGNGALIKSYVFISLMYSTQPPFPISGDIQLEN